MYQCECARSVSNLCSPDSAADMSEPPLESLVSLSCFGSERETLTERQFETLWNSVETSRALYTKQCLADPELACLARIIRKHGVVSEHIHATLRRQLYFSADGPKYSAVYPSQYMPDILQAFPGARIQAAELGYIEGDILWVNGVRYAIWPTDPQKKSILENMRRQIDVYLLRIERAIKLAVDSLKINSEDVITVLEQQLGLLAEYIGTARNRIVVQQVVDEMMETLLKLKSKLIEYALIFSTSVIICGVDIIKVAEMADLMSKEGKAQCPTICSFLSHRNEGPGLSADQRARWQRLFAQYLNVLGAMLEGAEDMSLIKLLNEVSTRNNF